MKKRFFVLTMILGVTIAGQSMASSFVDVSNDEIYADAIQNLTSYGVLKGYEDGRFNPNGYITRAELSKVSVILLGYDDQIAIYNNATGFSDVVSNHWANSYINICNQNGIIKGYADGTFAPNKQVTYAEAITIILRTLGYSTDVLGSNWPDAYIEKATNLGIIDNIVIVDPNWAITRAEVSLILDEAIKTDMYNSSQKLIEKMKLIMSEECIITEVDSSDNFSTTIGSYKKGNLNISDYIGQKVKLVFDEDKDVISLINVKQNGEEIIVENAIKDGINNMKISENTIVYYDGNKISYKEAWTNISQGDVITIYYGDNGSIDYIFCKDLDLLGPVLVKKQIAENDTEINGIDISSDKLKIIRDGESATKSDIKVNDVIYYNNVANILTVYSDKITGVYEEAYPSKTDVKTIKISGKEYEIETLTATNKLNESSSAYKLNDKITVALGEDGKIVDIIEKGSSYIDDYAIILSTSQEISTDEETKGRVKYYTTLFNMLEQTMVYESSKDYSGYKGKLINYDFEDGLLVINPANTSKVSGLIDKVNERIGDVWLTKDTIIIDKLGEGANGEFNVKVVELDDILKDNLKEEDVINVVRGGDFNDIQLLYLDNITGSNYIYGILISTDIKENGPSSYEVVSGSDSVVYRTDNTAIDVYSNTLVKILVEDGILEKIVELKSYLSGTRADAVDENRIKVNDSIYRLTSDVMVYNRTGFDTYKPASIYDLTSEDVKSIRLYGDNSTEKWVRIIVFSK